MFDLFVFESDNETLRVWIRQLDWNFHLNFWRADLIYWVLPSCCYQASGTLILNLTHTIISLNTPDQFRSHFDQNTGWIIVYGSIYRFSFYGYGQLWYASGNAVAWHNRSMYLSPAYLWVECTPCWVMNLERVNIQWWQLFSCTQLANS